MSCSGFLDISPSQADWWLVGSVASSSSSSSQRWKGGPRKVCVLISSYSLRLDLKMTRQSSWPLSNVLSKSTSPTGTAAALLYNLSVPHCWWRKVICTVAQWRYVSCLPAPFPCPHTACFVVDPALLRPPHATLTHTQLQLTATHVNNRGGRLQLSPGKTKTTMNVVQTCTG